jgi:hypothetical protein
MYQVSYSEFNKWNENGTAFEQQKSREEEDEKGNVDDRNDNQRQNLVSRKSIKVNLLLRKVALAIGWAMFPYLWNLIPEFLNKQFASIDYQSNAKSGNSMRLYSR